MRSDTWTGRPIRQQQPKNPRCVPSEERGGVRQPQLVRLTHTGWGKKEEGERRRGGCRLKIHTSVYYDLCTFGWARHQKERERDERARDENSFIRAYCVCARMCVCVSLWQVGDSWNYGLYVSSITMFWHPGPEIVCFWTKTPAIPWEKKKKKGKKQQQSRTKNHPHYPPLLPPLECSRHFTELLT